MSRKLWSEIQNYENIRVCVESAILRGIESMFPGLYGFLKIRSLVTYGSPPEAINDLRALVKLLSETFNDRQLLESTVRYVLSGLTKSPGDVAKALLSGDEDTFYMTLSKLGDSTLRKNCGKLLR